MDNEILIPKLGWSIDEATFVEWYKSNGEYINTGDEIFSVESDKAVQVVESIDSGWLSIDHDLPKEGQILKSGTVIGYLYEEKSNKKVNLQIGNFEDIESSQNSDELVTENKNKIKNLDDKTVETEGSKKLKLSDRIFISPRAKSLAKKLNIVSLSEIKGTGKNNRITEKDINIFHKSLNSKTGVIEGKSPNFFNLTINCSELLCFINSYNETERDKNLRLIDYLIKIIGHSFTDDNQNDDLNINQVCLLNNDRTKEPFFVSDPKHKGLVEINKFATIPVINSKIDQSTIVVVDLTEYNIQFFDPKIINPSLLSIGVGKYLSDISDDLYTLNICYINDDESNLLRKTKLITELTKSPYRLLL
jgi:hypothetical protein